MPALSRRTHAYVLLTLAVAIWGAATPVIRATVTYVPPFTFLMLRFWIAGLISLPLAIHFLRHNKINFFRCKHLLLSSMLGHVLALSFFFVGLEKTSAVEGSLITSFSPLLVSFLGFIVLKEIITKKEIEGTLVAFLGTLVIIFAPIIYDSTDLIMHRAIFVGNILFFIGVAFDGFYAIYMKKYVLRDKIITPLMQISFSFIIAAIVFTPLGLLEQSKIYAASTNLDDARTCTQGDIDKSIYNNQIACDSNGCFNTSTSNEYLCALTTHPSKFLMSLTRNLINYLSTKAVYGIIYMALISGILGYTFFNIGLKSIEASEASLFYYLQPIFGIPIAVIFLKEQITTIFILGAIITALGIYMAEVRKN